ncbi:hypothetical protein P167DRAFT_575978 [Morchella conica CCBAS932]|uniref:Uncharacterized protein n=1 Tax=Morchella conica CCBAS932 TaxID=1392247 RepID=A0A3N4KMV9_9PEZI|nr:hypothetical protein P167DRAFT_575978 [Morchella conica CCBAS932]
MHTCPVTPAVLSLALTIHILHTFRRSLLTLDPALYAAYTPTHASRHTHHTPASHATAAALLRTCHLHDALTTTTDILAASILPSQYTASGGGSTPLNNEDAMAVQVYASYHKAKRELFEAVDGIVEAVVGACKGGYEEQGVLAGRLRERAGVEEQRAVMQREMEKVRVAYRQVVRLGWDRERGRVVFLKACVGGWMVMGGRRGA